MNHNPLSFQTLATPAPTATSDRAPLAPQEDHADALTTDLRSAGSDGALPPPPAKTRNLGKFLSSSALVVLVVLVVSVASLLFMRRAGMGARMAFNPVKIDYEPPVNAEIAAHHKRVLRDLARANANAAFDASPVRRDPFVLPQEPSRASNTPDPHDEIARQALQRDAQIRDGLAKLTLNGVMGGRTPLARINGRTVKVGDVIDDLFMVAQIHDRAVELMVDQRTFTISMGEGVTERSTAQRGLRSNPMAPTPTPTRR